MPGAHLRALSEYKFVGTPLWRMSDGKDLVRVELTFHKKLPTPRYYKKGAESRKQPAPPAGEWPRQPAPATRPPPRRVPTQIERETLPPTTQTILQRPHQIIRPHYKNTAIITASPTITRPAPASSESLPSPPTKKARKESPAPATDRPIQYCSYHNDEEYSIHEKYDLQDVLNNKKRHCNHKGTKNPRRRRDEHRPASILFTSNLEEGLATHQGANVQVPPWRILHQGGRASHRKATEEYHILVWLPGAFLRRPKGKVPVRQSRTTLEIRVKTPFWIMGEDILLFSLTWVRTTWNSWSDYQWSYPSCLLREIIFGLFPFHLICFYLVDR